MSTSDHDMSTSDEAEFTDVSDTSSDVDSDVDSDIDSDSADLPQTMPGPQALQALPVELIGMLSELLDNEDLLAVRTTCRELRDGSAFEFCQRYLDFVEISGTRNSVRQLLAILTSPNLPHAQQTVKKLVVSADLLRSSEEYENPTDLEAAICSPTLPEDQQIAKQKSYEEPNATEVAHLLRAMPKMTTLKLVGDMNVLEQLRGAETAPVFLTCLAQLPGQLRRLDLFAVKLEGDVLSNMLEAHKGALNIISFNEITLDSPSALKRVLETLHSARIRRLELAWLRYTNPEAGTADLSNPNSPFANVILTNVSGEFLGRNYVEAIRGRVRPALMTILQRLEG